MTQDTPAALSVEMHAALCPAHTGGNCTCEKFDPAVDKAWAQFCAGIGDGPNAPYPGMIAAFERYYSQSFADKAWRSEAATWAAAWKASQAATSAAGGATGDLPPLPPHRFCLNSNPMVEGYTAEEMREYARAALAAQSPDSGAGSTHVHRKSGGRYTLIGEGKLQSDKPLPDMAEIAIYRGEDGRLWARDATEFAGRFDSAALAQQGAQNG